MKPTPKQPGIYITKKKEVMLFVEKEMHGEAFDCPACELFGFGTGALICEATEALQGDLDVTRAPTLVLKSMSSCQHTNVSRYRHSKVKKARICSA